MGQRCSSSGWKFPPQSADPCLWYAVCVRPTPKHNDSITRSVQGLYRRVDFIDIPRGQLQSVDDEKTEAVHSNLALITKKTYREHYQPCNCMFVRIYNSKFEQIEQKREFVFLWHNGQQWLFSNYQALAFYVDIKLGPQWVLTANAAAKEPDVHLAMLSQEYSASLDKIKMLKKIGGRFKSSSFELVIRNSFKLKDHLDREAPNMLSNGSLILEDQQLRAAYIGWRENIDVFYQSNQLLTAQQAKEEALKQENERKAKKVRKMIDDIDGICASSEFQVLLKKYRTQSERLSGWVHRDGFVTTINHGHYRAFKEEYIARKSNEQLAFEFIRELALQYHQYYHSLMAELQCFDESEGEKITFK
eukprot:CAMPEP_0197022004 /NCGR_PEP_ID=MMETSP1384-20130603/2909_1 /TAXON_ID=29189 /ORGANISM="Ammonia sp." /LENGTH=360 /DNA_ID=CAMNT_0042449961 /DNA_START=39 /DNA_END=1121 /DNA_ORIENTATION=+